MLIHYNKVLKCIVKIYEFTFFSFIFCYSTKILVNESWMHLILEQSRNDKSELLDLNKLCEMINNWVFDISAVFFYSSLRLNDFCTSVLNQKQNSEMRICRFFLFLQFINKNNCLQSQFIMEIWTPSLKSVWIWLLNVFSWTTIYTPIWICITNDV